MADGRRLRRPCKRGISTRLTVRESGAGATTLTEEAFDWLNGKLAAAEQQRHRKHRTMRRYVFALRAFDGAFATIFGLRPPWPKPLALANAERRSA